MKKFYLLILVAFLGSNNLKAQLPSGSYSDYFREGLFLIGENNYDMALKNFLEAYKKDSSSANINYYVGYCYLNSSTNKGLAERYLAKSTTKISKNYEIDNPKEKAAPPLAIYNYAKALHINYKFDEAMAQYDNFSNNYAKDKAMKEEVAYFRQQSEYAKEVVAAPINVVINNLGDSINSSYPEYSPVLSADESTIIYTTRRNTSTGGEKTPDGQFYEDIVYSNKNENGVWSSPKSIGQFVNSNGHEGSISLSADGQILIVYKDDEANGGGNIYYSNWDGVNWGPLQSFGSDVNSKYWETHACLSADNNTLYFVSDRPGGQGGRDIYRCVKLPNGAWSKALNLGPTINTKHDEDGPFIHPDGVTFIFASTGHRTIGGFDLFTSTIEEDRKFSEPINMGYPINTTDDDVFFTTSLDGKRAYFSSNKAGGFGEKDIYSMYIPEAKEKPLVLFKGAIIPATGQKLPDDLMVIVTDKESGQVIGKYRPKENGTFASILAPGKNYTFSYQAGGQEFYTEDIFVSNEISYQEIKKAINLDPVNLLGTVSNTNGIVLNTSVFNNPKDKNPISGAKITLIEKGGDEKVFDTDETGSKKAVSLKPDKLYVLVAEKDGKKSKEIKFNTVDIKGSKTISQVLYLEGGKSTGKEQPKEDTYNSKPIDMACGAPVKFKQRFDYNVDEIEEKADWNTLIEAIVSKTKECNPEVRIMSSASQVPTRLFGGNNRKLAESRAYKMEEKIKAEVTAKGGDASKIEFVKIWAVRGPVYATDYQNKQKYGPYQYVRVIAK